MLELLESNGAVVAYYEYDPWGKLLSVKDASGNAITSATHIANINPIRYRGGPRRAGGSRSETEGVFSILVSSLLSSVPPAYSFTRCAGAPSRREPKVETIEKRREINPRPTIIAGHPPTLVGQGPPRGFSRAA